ncbi:solute carrier organic anion transporter family member 5A1-like isoform X2 [Aphidius gifuensis]|uniref:solute carrier organic anion transporter family member 5A1-like isoform X2 n=1 Tax=Aphidius gifuensis TaxID=684658 RepID=UPI001CDB8FFF|nr:solute carrier organic anion transporter family member 5A1-like isoform X2 [Aphidius gifuensis]
MDNNNSVCSPENNNTFKNNNNMKFNLATSTTREIINSPSLLNHNIDDIIKKLPITSDIKFGLWIIHGKKLQKFAKIQWYVVVYGFLSLVFSASLAYYTGTITTIEKRFQIPSIIISFIGVSNNISQLLVSCVLSYYCTNGNRPRWMAIGIYIHLFGCLLALLPHLLYGPGDEAVELSKEYSDLSSNTKNIKYQVMQKFICLDNNTTKCHELNDNTTSKIIFFIAKFLSGIGGSLLFTLGVSYIDDNVSKIDAPKYASITYFIRLLGPGIGYCLSSFTLKFFIIPAYNVPTEDPRFVGAWWMGWIILSILLLISASIMLLFPKELPLTVARRILSKQKYNNTTLNNNNTTTNKSTSFNDMLKTFKRLLKNKTLMFNNAATICYLFGFSSYAMFMPKYIEVQYKQTASTSALITGIIYLTFCSSGLLTAGFIISKYEKIIKARHLTTWNIIVSSTSTICMLMYIVVGCTDNDKQIINMHNNNNNNDMLNCNKLCNCDYVSYNPICSEEGRTYVSACHAGCQNINDNGSIKYSECSCVLSKNINNKIGSKGTAEPGSCQVDCFLKLCLFICILSIVSFMATSGMATNFLISIRSIDEIDKTAALGLGLTITTLFAMIPSPLVFGYIIQINCIFSGKTCTGSSNNCWLYDTEKLRYMFNLTAAGAVAIGLCFDITTWHLVKHVKIFGDESSTCDSEKTIEEEER